MLLMLINFTYTGGINMTLQEKKELIKALGVFLETTIETEELQPVKSAEDETIEMLTIKECKEVAKGLSEHAIRQLVIQGKIPCLRVGKSKRGKILIAKKDFLNFLSTPE